MTTTNSLIHSPLRDIYPAGSFYSAIGDHQVAEHFGDAESEYQAAVSGAAIIDHSHLGRLAQIGPDAIDLLHRVTTNNIEAIPVGGSARTILASDRGRVVDVFRVVRTGQSELLLLCSGLFKSELIKMIEFYTIIEDSRLEDVSDSMLQLAIIGPEAEMLLSSMVPSVGALGPGESTEANGVRYLRAGTDEAEEFHVLMPAGLAAGVWRQMEGAGFTPVGSQTLQRRRVDLGIPSAGLDYSDRTNPLEIGLIDLVDFAKGCYVGQEVVARLDAYDKVQRTIVKVRSDSGLTAGDDLKVDGRTVGTVGSVITDGKGVTTALALVRNEFAEAGVKLATESGASVVALTRDK
ncbi:MAG: aminomethyl transferase family protein [Chloroflexi bacterium]|nr:aminomethyl transferase family protein [Chloroflexota bacterium]